MSPSVADVARDLIAEQDALDRIVADLEPADFGLATPSPRWTVADQIGHLTYFDRTAALAITDEPAFAEHRAELFAADAPAEEDLDDATLGPYRAMEPEELVAAWREARRELADAATILGDDDRVEWYGPSMGAKSFLTARLMEAWAHGQDVADAVGAARTASDRLIHIAQLGFITQKWSFLVRGADPLPVQVGVRLTAPSGDEWVFGDPDGDDRVSGPAVDFCLVVTQRRHVDDTALEVVGEHARRWMENAQAFAGGPTTGPEPSSRAGGR
jgi:uncharacterized protein (TIGR03084 family)